MELKRATLGYVCKNGHVQKDINQSIFIINITPLVYKNLILTVQFLYDLEKRLLIIEIGRFLFQPEKSGHVHDLGDYFSTPIRDLPGIVNFWFDLV